MDKSSMTVSMPLTEFERLKSIESGYKEIIGILERANVDGIATMTDGLKVLIEEIYL